MKSSTVASTRYRLNAPSSVPRPALAWIASFLEGLFLGTSTGTVSFDVSITDIVTERKIFVVRTAGLGVGSAVDSIRRDLAKLTIDEFQQNYHIHDSQKL